MSQTTTSEDRPKSHNLFMAIEQALKWLFTTKETKILREERLQLKSEINQLKASVSKLESDALDLKKDITDLREEKNKTEDARVELFNRNKDIEKNLKQSVLEKFRLGQLVILAFH